MGHKQQFSPKKNRKPHNSLTKICFFFLFFSHRINDTLFKVTTFDRYSLIQYINSWMGKMYGNWRFKQWNTKIFQKFTSQADFYSPERSYAASSYVGPAKIQ